MLRHSRNTDNCHCAHSAGNVKLLSLELLSRVFEHECYTAWARGICRVLICWLLHWLSSEPPQEPRQIPNSLEHLLFTPVMGREGADPKHLAYWGLPLWLSETKGRAEANATVAPHLAQSVLAFLRLPYTSANSKVGGVGVAAQLAPQAAKTGLDRRRQAAVVSPLSTPSVPTPSLFFPSRPPPVPISSPALIRPPPPPSLCTPTSSCCLHLPKLAASSFKAASLIAF